MSTSGELRDEMDYEIADMMHPPTNHAPARTWEERRGKGDPGLLCPCGFMFEDYRIGQFKTWLQSERQEAAREARRDELSLLNARIATEGWHKERAYLMFPYINDRWSQLQAEGEAG